MATHSQIDNVPCPSCRNVLPGIDVRCEIGKKVEVNRLCHKYGPFVGVFHLFLENIVLEH